MKMKAYLSVRGRVMLVAVVMLSLFIAMIIRIASLAATTQWEVEVHHEKPKESDVCQGYCLPGRPVHGQQEV